MLGTYQNIDCMELMATLPDKSIDLAIVDPPYGINYDKSHSQKNKDNKISNGGKWKKYNITNWDFNIPSEDYFIELFRVSKNQIIWGGNFYIKYLYNTSCMIVWNKIQRNYMTDGEIAWSSFKRDMKIFDYSRIDSYVNDCDNKIHPTQKPVKLYEWLLTNYAKPNDLILDTHCGSASSLIACENLGFKYIASELDKDYYSQSLQRLQNHLSQGKLFQRVGRDEIQSIQPSMFA